MSTAAPRSVAERLSDAPKVRDTILAAAAAARGLSGADPKAYTHAWLFTGPPGAGRSNAALAFAAALVCTDSDTLGCGRCKSCRDALAGTHTDLVLVAPRALSIKVEPMRDIVARASRLPTTSSFRILIIQNADRLTTDAGNALLKLVEEPPEQTVVVLCAPSTDPQDISQTLRSRCRHLYIPSPSEAEVVRVLMEEEGASESDARLAAATSLRHIGRARKLVTTASVQTRRANAINLAELVFHGAQAFQAAAALVKRAQKEGVDDFAEADALEREKLETALGMGAKGKGAAKAAGQYASELKALETEQKARGTRRKRDALDLVLVDFAGVYRDAFVIKSGADLTLTHPDFEGLAREIAERTSFEGLVACQDAITQCRERLHQNVDPTVAFNGMLGHIRKACDVR